MKLTGFYLDQQMLSPLVLLFCLDTKMAYCFAKLQVLRCSGGGKMLTIKRDLKLNVTYIPQQHLLLPRESHQQDVKIMQLTRGGGGLIIEVCQKQAKSILVLSLVYVFLLFSPILEKMLEKQKTDIWKGLCFLLHPAFMPLRGVYLPCRKEERALAAAGGLTQCCQAVAAQRQTTLQFPSGCCSPRRGYYCCQ